MRFSVRVRGHASQVSCLTSSPSLKILSQSIDRMQVIRIVFVVLSLIGLHSVSAAESDSTLKAPTTADTKPQPPIVNLNQKKTSDNAFIDKDILNPDWVSDSDSNMISQGKPPASKDLELPDLEDPVPVPMDDNGPKKSPPAKQQCAVASWKEYSSEIAVGNWVIKFAQNHRLLQRILERMNSMQLSSLKLPSEEATLLGTKYHIDLTIDNIAVSGLKDTTLKAINITSDSSLQFGGKMDDFKVSLHSFIFMTTFVLPFSCLYIFPT
jgi:hypothetical protein